MRWAGPGFCRRERAGPFLLSASPSSVFFFLDFAFPSVPPYFSSSSSVESYLVASFSFWIVLALSSWRLFSFELRLSIRTS